MPKQGDHFLKFNPYLFKPSFMVFFLLDMCEAKVGIEFALQMMFIL